MSNTSNINYNAFQYISPESSRESNRRHYVSKSFGGLGGKQSIMSQKPGGMSYAEE